MKNKQTFIQKFHANVRPLGGMGNSAASVGGDGITQSQQDFSGPGLSSGLQTSELIQNHLPIVSGCAKYGKMCSTICRKRHCAAS